LCFICKAGDLFLSSTIDGCVGRDEETVVSVGIDNRWVVTEYDPNKSKPGKRWLGRQGNCPPRFDALMKREESRADWHQKVFPRWCGFEPGENRYTPSANPPSLSKAAARCFQPSCLRIFVWAFAFYKGSLQDAAAYHVKFGISRLHVVALENRSYQGFSPGSIPNLPNI